MSKILSIHSVGRIIKNKIKFNYSKNIQKNRKNLKKYFNKILQINIMKNNQN